MVEEAAIRTVKHFDALLSANAKSILTGIRMSDWVSFNLCKKMTLGTNEVGSIKYFPQGRRIAPPVSQLSS